MERKALHTLIISEMGQHGAPGEAQERNNSVKDDRGKEAGGTLLIMLTILTGLNPVHVS